MNPMVVSIIIMALCIVLFITEKIPYAVAGLLGLVLLVLFKICSFTEAFGAFAEETFFICFGMVIVGSGLDHSGLLSLIGDRVVRAAGNNTRKLLVICVFMAAKTRNDSQLSGKISVCSSAATTASRPKAFSLSISGAGLKSCFAASISFFRGLSSARRNRPSVSPLPRPCSFPRVSRCFPV